MDNRSAENGHSYFFPGIFGETSSVFHIKYVLAVGFL